MAMDKTHAHWAEAKRPRPFYAQIPNENHSDLNEQLESLLLTQQLGRMTDMPRWYEGRHVWNLS